MTEKTSPSPSPGETDLQAILGPFFPRLDLTPPHPPLVTAKTDKKFGVGGAKKAKSAPAPTSTKDDDFEPPEGPLETVPEPEPKKKAQVVLSHPRWDAAKPGFNEETPISVDVLLPEEHAYKTRVTFELFAKTPKGPESICTGEGHAKEGKATCTIPVYIPSFKDEDGNRLQKVEYYFIAKHSEADPLDGSTTPKLVDEMANRVIESHILQNVIFTPGKSFIRTSEATDLKALGQVVKEWKGKHPDGKLAVFGHADAVGEELSNKTLSERRAKSIHAYLAKDPKPWEALYGEEDWGLANMQELLKHLGHDPGAIDGQDGPKTRAAVKDFQGKSGLGATGNVDSKTREALFLAYFERNASPGCVAKAFDAIDGKAFTGCSEFNLIENTQGSCETNRRVAVLLLKVSKNFPINYPCKQGAIGPCQSQAGLREGERRTTGFRCRFYDKLVVEKMGADLESAVFSEAPDYTDLPNLWLPYGFASRVAVRQAAESEWLDSVTRKSDDTYPLVVTTREPKEMRYWHHTGESDWDLEQCIDQAEAPQERMPVEDEDENKEELADKVKDIYQVKPGDTLSGIASQCGKTVADLQRWNGIQNADRLEVGQTLYLSEAASLGVTTLFLDGLRHPIANLPFMLKFDGKSVTGRTGPEGLVPRQVTRSADSDVEVWMQDMAGAWQQIARTASEYGHKLITLVSNAVVLSGQTRELPKGVEAKPGNTAKSNDPAKAPASGGAQPPLPKSATGKASKNNPATKTKAAKGPKGEPVLKIEVDIPQGLLTLFAQYTGNAITEKDWEVAAADIECDAAVLKAFAEVESGGRSSFWRLNRGDGAHIPALLFERHYFSRLTGKRFDQAHPDISWPTGYRQKKKVGQADQKMSDGRIDQDDVYGNFASAYLRLIQAYRLDAEAALKSCSWGKFQIMGDNYLLCGSDNAKDFVISMCTSEIAQIKLICEFIRKKPAAWKNPRNKKLGKEITLWDAVKTKNWQAIAFNYNGPGYATYAYDTKIKAAYETHRA